jgi:catalase-peroxidase
LVATLQTLERIQTAFNAQAAGGKRVSLADLIVLGGAAAVERAAAIGGHAVSLPSPPARGDPRADLTQAASFARVEPTADGFRNYVKKGEKRRSTDLLIDRSSLLGLTAPEMTVLVGGMRVLGANTGHAAHGVFTERPGVLTNDFFVHLLDNNIEWSPSTSGHIYEGRDRRTGRTRWTATAVDLVFGAHAQLRAIAEVYGCSDAQQKFVTDFVAAWNKVMNLDRFDLR